MPEYNLRPTLKAFQFTPQEVKFTPFTPQLANIDLLANSLTKMEARQEKATERMSAIDQSLGKIGEQLHNDEETQRWFNDYKQKVKDNIGLAASMGDYGEAIRRANLMAGQISQDNSLKNRVAANANYQAQDKLQQQRMNNGEISHKTYEWWKANNPYTFSENIDPQTGEVTSWNEMDYHAPVKDINWLQFAAQAFQGVSESSRSNTRGSSTSNSNTGVTHTDENGKEVSGAQVGDDGKPSGYDYTVQNSSSNSSQHSDTVHWKTKESIQDVIDMMAADNPDAYAAMRQQFEVENWELTQEVEKLNGMTEGTDDYNRQQQYVNRLRQRTERNGAPDLEKFFAGKLEENGYALRLSYRNTATSNITSTSTANSRVPNITKVAAGTTADGRQVTYDTNTGQFNVSGDAVAGPHVVDYFGNFSVANSTDGIYSLFGSNPEGLPATGTEGEERTVNGVTYVYHSKAPYVAGWLKK